MNERKIIGITPWLPWPLTRWTWWTEPVHAERLAALRIGFACVLLLDVLTTYFPMANEFFGRGSLGSPEVFAPGPSTWYRWSLLNGVNDPRIYHGALALWAVAGVLLLAGVLPRISACIAWGLSISIMNVNCYLHNSGDNVRSIILFYLMLCPCAAAWSLKTFAARRRGVAEEIYVPAWPVRLLFVQLVTVYFLNGVYKLAGSEWRDGQIMYSVLANLSWTRFSYADLPMPLWAIQAMTWTTLVFELGFPLFVMIPRVRTLALCVGVFFHLGTAVLLQLGPFPFYMMCLYLPLLPWEKLAAHPVYRAPLPDMRLRRMLYASHAE